jgi:hypothetical protein
MPRAADLIAGGEDSIIILLLFSRAEAINAEGFFRHLPAA